MTGDESLDQQSIGDFLGQLAARMAAPGAGATAAVEAAPSASLVATAAIARLAVEANLPGIDDDAARRKLVEAVAEVEDLARSADEIEAEVRQRLLP